MMIMREGERAERKKNRRIKKENKKSSENVQEKYHSKEQAFATHS